MHGFQNCLHENKRIFEFLYICYLSIAHHGKLKNFIIFIDVLESCA